MSFKLNRRGLLKAGAATGLLAATGLPLQAAPKRGGAMRMGMPHGQTSDSMDPGSWENGFMTALGFTVHNYMTEVDTDGSLKAELAESWEASADAKTWTFKIRQGVTFHNGKSLTSGDVVASINHHRGEDSQSAAKVIVDAIAEIGAPDSETVVITLDSGNADFPFILTDYHLPIGPSDGDNVDWNSGIGAGAYKLESFDPGVRAAFTRNENYWKSDRGHFDTVEMLSIVDPTARTNALLSKQVDAIGRVDVKTTQLFDRAPDVELTSIAGTLHYTFPMNTQADPYTNNHVRLAVKYGVNREELVQKVLNGFGSVGNDHPIGAGQRYYASDLAQREYDPDKSKFHLKQAGLDSVDLELSAADAAYGGAVDAALLFANSAKAGGVNINVNREPNDGYWSNVWMKKSFCACYWGGRPIEDQMFSTAYATGANWNDTFWSNERFDKLLVEARAELDEDKRRDMYVEMQTIVSNDGGVVVPMFANHVSAISKALGTNDWASNWELDGSRFAERWWFA